MKSTSRSELSSTSKTIVGFTGTLPMGFVAWILAAAVVSAQPREFCLGGFTWESIPEVPPAPARELTIGESLSLGSQLLFRSSRLRNEMLVSAHGAGTCQSCHSSRGEQGVGAAQSLETSSDLVIIEPLATGWWFWGQSYEALLVRRTERVCQDEEQGVLAGAPTVEGVRGHQESDSDIRFIIESSHMLEGLESPDTAPLLVAPVR